MTQTPPETHTSHLRVLFFDHTAALSGGEIALLNLVGHLDLKKITPVVVLGAEGPLAEQLRPIAETHVLPLSSRVTGQRKDTLGIKTLFRFADMATVWVYARRLARFIRDHHIDLVHTNSLKADIIGGLAGLFSSRPVVWHVRDRIEDDYLPPPAVRAFRLLCRMVPSYVITNSAATLGTLRLRRDFRSMAVPSGVKLTQDVRIASVVHDGTKPESPPATDPFAQGLSRIGLIGRISPWKGQHIFIQAAAQVVRRVPGARFLIIGAALFGEDEYEREVRQLAGHLDLENVLQFTGFCTDMRRAISELDLVVHASTKGEPFGQVIVEGMAAGKPVVATNGGGVPEIVQDGVTGILVPMGDVTAMAEAICRICADPVLASIMGSNGKKRIAEHFTIEQSARKVESVYAYLLA
jgi:glycosyltransferase involved in cell wall biosynthesis